MQAGLRRTLARSAIGLLTSFAVFGVNATVNTGRITEIALDKDIAGNLVFIKLDRTKSSIPGCQINTGWDYVLPIADAADKNMFAMLVAAKTANQTVTIRGADTCAAQFSSIELAVGVRIVNP